MLDNVKRFDMAQKPKRQKLTLLIRTLAISDLIKHKQKLTKINMEGIKPPYLLLCNHNSFYDFKVESLATFPKKSNYVIAIDGFIKREGLLRTIGGICKRKFTNDIILPKQLKEVIKNKDIAVIYPEARYSLCGTQSVLPESLAKLVTYLGVPVVTLICHGNHVCFPFYNIKDHNMKGLEAEMTCIISKEEAKSLPSDEIMRRINEKFVYDDFKWQKDNNIICTYKKRAEGLHKPLYKCPNCLTEFEMSSSGTILKCDHCHKEWEMNELGELHALEGKTEFSHIPDWYEWERKCVRKEVEEGKYFFKSKVRIDSLPNADGYIDLGMGELIHDLNGFKLTGSYQGEDFTVELNARSTYSVHVEYEYLGKFGDCVDLNTLKDTLYVYPKDCLFSVTKIAIATEEIYKFLNKK